MPDEEDASHSTTDAERLRSCARQFLMLVHNTSSSPSRRRLAIHHMVKAVRYALPPSSDDEMILSPSTTESSDDSTNLNGHGVDVSVDSKMDETNSDRTNE